ncbi:MAG: RidA family protein [Alphaproteobacteria bacterium]|nr:RidA family protein [Alphaproteobacteria bacterium]
MEIVQPDGWARPHGYSNGIAAEGRFLFVAGQIGWDAQQNLVGPDFIDQLRQALINIRAILETAAVGPEALVRLTWYVTDIADYRARVAEVGTVYREVLGKVFPAMAVVAVSELVEPGAKVEIEATAVLPR